MSQEKGTKKRLNKEARFACLKNPKFPHCFFQIINCFIIHYDQEFVSDIGEYTDAVYDKFSTNL